MYLLSLTVTTPMRIPLKYEPEASSSFLYHHHYCLQSHTHTQMTLTHELITVSPSLLCNILEE